MSKPAELTVTVTHEKKQEHQQTIVESIKQIAINSEGQPVNNYPLITQLCELYQLFEWCKRRGYPAFLFKFILNKIKYNLAL